MAFNVVDCYVSGVVSTAEFHMLHCTEDNRWAAGCCMGWQGMGLRDANL